MDATVTAAAALTENGLSGRSCFLRTRKASRFVKIRKLATLFQAVVQDVKFRMSLVVCAGLSANIWVVRYSATLAENGHSGRSCCVRKNFRTSKAANRFVKIRRLATLFQAVVQDVKFRVKLVVYASRCTNIWVVRYCSRKALCFVEPWKLATLFPAVVEVCLELRLAPVAHALHLVHVRVERHPPGGRRRRRSRIPRVQFRAFIR